MKIAPLESSPEFSFVETPAKKRNSREIFCDRIESLGGFRVRCPPPLIVLVFYLIDDRGPFFAVNRY